MEFFNGTTSIAAVTSAPYTTNWSNVAAGSYSVTAVATDNLGATTTSAAMPVAVTANQPKVYDIHTDHIDTPRVITDANGNEVWRWDSAPFGETLPNEQPTQATNKFTFNLRFPGQYYDQETGLHYNYFRDYDPSTGRYVESDPIGLMGGSNTYTYVSGRPFRDHDRFGLCPTCTVSGGFGTGASAGGWFGPALSTAAEATGVVGAGLGGYAAGTWINNHYGDWIREHVVDWIAGDPWMAAKNGKRGEYAPGFIDAVEGARKWGRRNGVPNAVDIFHDIKKGDRGRPGSKANDDCSVNPDTGDVHNGSGENIGNLEDGAH